MHLGHRALAPDPEVWLSRSLREGAEVLLLCLQLGADPPLPTRGDSAAAVQAGLVLGQTRPSSGREGPARSIAAAVAAASWAVGHWGAFNSIQNIQMRPRVTGQS